MNEDLRQLGLRRLAQGKNVEFCRHHFMGPNGEGLVRELIHHPGSVVVVPVLDGEVLMLRQFRPATGDWLWELPAGKCDHPGEAPDQTARRECAEETGFLPGSLRLVSQFFNSPGFCDEATRVYIGEELAAVGRQPQGWEERTAQVVKMPVSDLKRRLEEGEIVDAKTLIGLNAVMGFLT